jgi:NADPH-dependent 2,4-dienoyl-CoA reductase/sulfur reductase-like enzyme/nitrite reductase/ring-hydroxylating ferredoxin subunit
MVEHDVLAAAALADGAMQGVEAGGRALLLVRLGGTVYALGGTCPHAGGKLAEGVLRHGVVLCPWHKAGFAVATGVCVEPPALDDLPRFPVREAGGRILVTLTDGPEALDPVPDMPGEDARCMAVVGTGAAGAAAAQALRQAGFVGRVAMIGPEEGPPYDRTIQSKYVLSATEGGEKTPLQDADFYRRHRIERLRRRVTELLPARRRIVFEGGETLDYDAALLATGGVPNRLEVPGGERAMLLRSDADAAAIARAADATHHAVVLGSGFIAMEAAASLRERGLLVTLVAPDPVPLGRVLGKEVGGALRRLLERRGVTFRLESRVASVEPEAVRLEDGTVLPAGLVVAGLGISPNTAMLRGVTFRQDGGVDVDRALRVTGGLFAAGDVAGFPLHGDGERVRVEHWRVALQQGKVAAQGMLGRAAAYDAVPYFWTIMFKKRVDYVGHAADWDGVQIDGDLEKPEFMAFYIKRGIVLAVAGMDRDRPMALCLALMAEQRDWTPDGLRAALGQST